MPPLRWPLAFALCALTLVRPGHARAGVNECVAQAERGQELRQAGNLLQSQQDLRACADAACPALIRNDCTTWLGELETELPSIIVRVVDVYGQDTSFDKLTIDQQIAAQTRVALPFDLDPGKHTVSVIVAGHTYEETFVLRIRERNRLITIAAAAVPMPTETNAVEKSSGRAIGWGLAGMSAAAFASFAYFGTTGTQRADSLRGTCAPGCTDAQVKDARDKLWKADASLGLAVGVGAVATWLLLRPATPIHNRSEKTVGKGFLVGVASNAATLVWVGRF